jgi:hypothetical protein
MQHSIFLARLIGPIALVAAIGLLVNRTGYRALAHEFLRSPALVYLSGILAMTAGVAIVLHHNVWLLGWPVLLTLFGWMAAVGGAVRTLAPQQVRSFGEAMLDKPEVLTIGGVIWLAIGLLLCFFGYVR